MPFDIFISPLNTDDRPSNLQATNFTHQLLFEEVLSKAKDLNQPIIHKEFSSPSQSLARNSGQQKLQEVKCLQDFPQSRTFQSIALSNVMPVECFCYIRILLSDQKQLAGSCVLKNWIMKSCGFQDGEAGTLLRIMCSPGCFLFNS